jgi:2-polyprenyl-3-methyl-5-hydroxy-6-metoxy-1,4-benzoquinol methylase
VIKPSLRELREIVSTELPGMTSEQKDEMAIPSYLHGNPAIRWLFWKRYETIARLLPPEKTERILEFGCGIGPFLPELSLHAKQIYAIDLFPGYAKVLCEQRRIPVIFINSLDEIEDRSLDALVAADVLEHVDDLEGILRQFSHKLSPGGQLIISGPTENFLYRLGRILAGFAGKGGYHHTNIDNIINVARSAGFMVTRKIILPFPFLPPLFKIYNLTRPKQH